MNQSRKSETDLSDIGETLGSEATLHTLEDFQLWTSSDQVRQTRIAHLTTGCEYTVSTVTMYVINAYKKVTICNK